MATRETSPNKPAKPHDTFATHFADVDTAGARTARNTPLYAAVAAEITEHSRTRAGD